MQEGAAAEAPDVEDVANPWTGSVNLGLNYSDSATTTSNIYGKFQISRATDKENFDFAANYFYGYSDGVVTENQIYARAEQNWLIDNSPWSIFAQGVYQWDDFEIWEQRVSPYAGFGYAALSNDEFKLTLKIGAGGTWETAGDNDFRTQLLLEAAADWTIDATQSLTALFSIAPDFKDFSSYLLTVSANYKIKMGTDTPLSLNVSVRDIYDSNPTPGGTENDLKFIVSLGYDF